MIKVEKLLDGGKGHVIKDESKVPLLPGLLMDEQQYETAVVETGSVMFSIHEVKLETKTAPKPPEPAPAPAQPTIVFPKRNK